MWRRERKLKFKLLFLQAHTASRVRCAALMFILCRAAKNEPRKRAKGCRLWKLLPCRSSWRKKEKNIKVFCASLAILPSRAAGGDSKDSTMTSPSWACAYAPKRAKFCQNEKPRRLLKSRREAGGSQGERPGSFSWLLLC